MKDFLQVIAKFSLAISLVLFVLLVALGYLLIWRPEIIVNFLRYGLAGLCFAAAIALLIRTIIAVFKIRK